MHKYDLVAYIVNPNMTIEFLLERYNFTLNSSLLMALDPDKSYNKDSTGRVVLNTEFIIAQNNNLTLRVLKKLALYTKTIRGCDQ